MKSWSLPYFDQDRLALSRYEDGILKFTNDISYSTGNFSILREKHAKLQLDSVNGTKDRLNTILMRTGWPQEFFKDKVILECGCGAGPDTEILLMLGARVIAVDLAGGKQALANLGDSENLELVQADIMNLPLRPGLFDIVWCHRVLQHTPNPEKTLSHILKFVKPDGAVFVHSYARTPRQMLRWKYALLPFTRKIKPETLYNLIEASAPTLYKVTSFLYKMGRFGTFFATTFIPFCNYKNKKTFQGKSDEFIIEVGVHDTFDALSPPYDKPIGIKSMSVIAKNWLKQPYEIIYMFNKTILLLRTVVKK